MNIPLGSWVRDKVTLCTGIVTACCERLHDTTSYAVQPRHLVDGAPVKEVWIVEGRLERLKPPQE